MLLKINKIRDGVEYVYDDEQGARLARQQLIRLGYLVSLLAEDGGCYIFDVYRKGN